MEEHSTPTGLVATSAGADRATDSNTLEGLGPMQSIDQATCLGRSIWILWKDRISCVDEVSFKIKGTFQCAHDQCGLQIIWTLLSCMCLESYYFCQIVRSIRTSSGRCWMCTSCRLERSMHLLIKINPLEEVSLLLHVVYFTVWTSRCRCAKDLSRE